MELFQAGFPFIVFSAIAPLAFLFLRLVLAFMFIDSGRRHLSDPKERAKGLGLPVWLTIIVGTTEVVGGILITLGLFTHYAAFFLAGVMVGALYFKIFVWKTGIYGKNNNGWYYDALLLAGVGILFTVGAGAWSLDAVL